MGNGRNALDQEGNRDGGSSRRIIIRAGTTMHCRDGHTSRARHDHEVIAIPTTTVDGWDGWSFRRGYGAQTTYWYVYRQDVGPEDFPDGNPPDGSAWTNRRR